MLSPKRKYFQTSFIIIGEKVLTQNCGPDPSPDFCLELIVIAKRACIN